MQSYSIEYTRSHLKELLSNLPFEITRYGSVIAKVVGKSSTNVVQDTSGVKTIKNIEKLHITNLCEHGYMFGLCKFGCK
jgi:hypothetical protein